MVIGVVLITLATALTIYGGVAAGLVIAKKLGYDPTSRYYYKHMAKKGQEENYKLLNGKMEPTLRNVKACVKHTLKPRCKLARNYLRTVENYNIKYRGKEKKYMEVVSKLDFNQQMKHIAGRMNNQRAERRYAKRVSRLNGLKVDMELENPFLTRNPSFDLEVDYVSRGKMPNGQEWVDGATYIACYDEKKASEFDLFNHANSLSPSEDKGHGYPHVADLIFNSESGQKKMAVSALNEKVYRKGVSLICDMALEVCNNADASERGRLFPITYREVCKKNGKFKTLEMQNLQDLRDLQQYSENAQKTCQARSL